MKVVAVIRAGVNSFRLKIRLGSIKLNLVDMLSYSFTSPCVRYAEQESTVSDILWNVVYLQDEGCATRKPSFSMYKSFEPPLYRYSTCSGNCPLFSLEENRPLSNYNPVIFS